MIIPTEKVGYIPLKPSGAVGNSPKTYFVGRKTGNFRCLVDPKREKTQLSRERPKIPPAPALVIL